MQFVIVAMKRHCDRVASSDIHWETFPMQFKGKSEYSNYYWMFLCCWPPWWIEFSPLYQHYTLAPRHIHFCALTHYLYSLLYLLITAIFVYILLTFLNICICSLYICCRRTIFVIADNVNLYTLFCCSSTLYIM